MLSLPVLVLSSAIGFSNSWTITNSGNSFSPGSITIAIGDDVTFNLETIHNAVEVSQATWNANGNTPLDGGFQVGFGGGQVTPQQLETGTHYYVCAPHALSGMKGTIIVQNVTRIEEALLAPGLSVYPNPTFGSLSVEAADWGVGAQYYITDLGGRKIAGGELDNELTSIDISYLAKGTYLIGIIGQKRRPIKLVKF